MKSAKLETLRTCDLASVGCSRRSIVWSNTCGDQPDRHECSLLADKLAEVEGTTGTTHSCASRSLATQVALSVIEAATSNPVRSSGRPGSAPYAVGVQLVVDLAQCFRRAAKEPHEADANVDVRRAPRAPESKASAARLVRSIQHLPDSRSLHVGARHVNGAPWQVRPILLSCSKPASCVTKHERCSAEQGGPVACEEGSE